MKIIKKANKKSISKEEWIRIGAASGWYGGQLNVHPEQETNMESPKVEMVEDNVVLEAEGYPDVLMPTAVFESLLKDDSLGYAVIGSNQEVFEDGTIVDETEVSAAKFKELLVNKTDVNLDDEVLNLLNSISDDKTITVVQTSHVQPTNDIGKVNLN